MVSTISGVLTLRADTEAEAVEIIENAKKNPHFILGKYSSELKEVKEKGEVIETFYKVTITANFNDIKEPLNDVYVYCSFENPDEMNAGADDED